MTLVSLNIFVYIIKAHGDTTPKYHCPWIKDCQIFLARPACKNVGMTKKNNISDTLNCLRIFWSNRANVFCWRASFRFHTVAPPIRPTGPGTMLKALCFWVAGVSLRSLWIQLKFYKPKRDRGLRESDFDGRRGTLALWGCSEDLREASEIFKLAHVALLNRMCFISISANTRGLRGPQRDLRGPQRGFRIMCFVLFFIHICVHSRMSGCRWQWWPW